MSSLRVKAKRPQKRQSFCSFVLFFLPTFESGARKIFSVILAKVEVNENFSRQSGSIAEISVAKSTNAEKCTTVVYGCVFEVIVV